MAQKIPQFGAAIARLRREAGLSQLELAGRLNVSQAQVSYWESGKGRVSAEYFARIALIFDVTPHKFMELAEQLSDNGNGRAA
jgi:transcriptional regulator with XRE-family HTH domain